MAERQNHRFLLVSLESLIQDLQEGERNLESRKLTNKKTSYQKCLPSNLNLNYRYGLIVNTLVKD